MSEQEPVVPNPPVPPQPSGRQQPSGPPAQQPYAGQPPYPYPAQAPYPGAPVHPGAPAYPAQPPYPGQAPVGAQPAYPTQAPAGPMTFAAPSAAPARGALATPAPAQRGPGLGVVALILAVVAVVAASVIAGVAGFTTGLGVGQEMALRPISADVDLSYLTPVRESVLWLEIAFWLGTALGIWAIIQGIAAISTRRGRGPAIAAVVLAAIGPFVFLFVTYAVIVAGVAAGSSPLGL